MRKACSPSVIPRRGLALAFLALPIVAIFVHVPPGRLIDQLSNPVVTDALVVSFKTSLIAQAFILLFGTPTAYLLASRRFPGRSLCVTLVELAARASAAVAGIGLLVAFGRSGSSDRASVPRGSRSRSRRPRSRSRSRSSPALFTSDRRSRPSRRSTPTSSPLHAPSVPAPRARSSASFSPCPGVASPRERRSRSRVDSVSSVPRSCSPAASRR